MNKKELITKIVIFEDGRYFAGVKSMYVRKTNRFKDAKIINGDLNRRDMNYLQDEKYKLVNVKYTIEVKDD